MVVDKLHAFVAQIFVDTALDDTIERLLARASAIELLQTASIYSRKYMNK
jgi:hypothetical protein